MAYVLEHQDEAERLEWQATLPQYDLRKEFEGLYIAPSSRVLDAGCGTGLISRYLFESQTHEMFQIDAIDFSDVRIQQAKNLTKGKPYAKNIHFNKGDVYELQFEENTFDQIVNRYVFQHLPELDGAAREFYRVLKPEGRVHLVDHDGIFVNYHTNNDEFNQMLEEVRRGFNFDLFAGRKIPSVFKKAGFQNVQWKLMSNPFHGQDLVDEIKNTEQRLVFARPVIEEILGSKEKTDRFNELYLSEMSKEGSVLFHNTFIITATK